MWGLFNINSKYYDYDEHETCSHISYYILYIWYIIIILGGRQHPKLCQIHLLHIYLPCNFLSACACQWTNKICNRTFILCYLSLWKREAEVIFVLLVVGKHAVCRTLFKLMSDLTNVGNAVHTTWKHGSARKASIVKSHLPFTFARLHTWPFTILSFVVRFTVVLIWSKFGCAELSQTGIEHTF